MQNFIQKTHYEMTRDLIDKQKLFVEQNFQSFINTTETFCGKYPSYPEFILSPSLKYLGELGKKHPEHTAELTVVANVLFHIYSLYQHHERIYYISPKLAINLARTEVNIDTYFLKSPFPEIYVQIDPGLFFLIDPLDGKEQPVRAFYINYSEKDDIKYLRIMVAALRSNYSELSTANDNAIFYFKVELEPGKIKDSIERYLASMHSRKDELKKYGGMFNIDHLKELFYFVFNALLYITSRNADVINQLPFDFQKAVGGLRNNGKIRKMLQRQAKTSEKPILVVGSQVLSPYSYEQVKNSGGVGKWKLEKKIYVSGHWKTQWYGSEKDNSRHPEIIYIEPYEKGPELAEVIDRKYQVGTA